MRGTIVCDVTDPLAGRTAAEFAGALATRLRLRLVLVHVVAVPPEEDVEARTLDEVTRELASDAELRLAVGDHVQSLARIADEEGADLVVLGARPVGLGGRNFNGALARELQAATPVPILVAPPSTRRRSERRLSAPAEVAAR